MYDVDNYVTWGEQCVAGLDVLYPSQLDSFILLLANPVKCDAKCKIVNGEEKTIFTKLVSQHIA